jgi:hypothetical protein
MYHTVNRRYTINRIQSSKTIKKVSVSSHSISLSLFSRLIVVFFAVLNVVSGVVVLSLGGVWLDVGLNLELEPHVKIQEHEADTDQERERAPGLVGDREQGEERGVEAGPEPDHLAF